MTKIQLDRSDFVEQNEDYEFSPSDDPDGASPFDRMLKALGLGLDDRDSVDQVIVFVSSFSTIGER